MDRFEASRIRSMVLLTARADLHGSLFECSRNVLKTTVVRLSRGIHSESSHERRLREIICIFLSTLSSVAGSDHTTIESFRIVKCS